jgi:hypothetical protein
LLIWRLRVRQAGAYSLNFGFERYRLPKGARLVVHDPANAYPARVFTERDNAAHGQLWTPVVIGDEAVLELTLPADERDDYALELIQIGGGYRIFGVPPAEKAGACNVDVICPEGDAWRGEIPSVAVYTVNGVWTCTGAMVNNSASDQTPYFLTANHCGVSAANDQTLVIYWNFESPVCGLQSGGSLSEFNSGTIFRATYAASDFCLVELEELPDPAFGVTYAGWSRAADDAEEATAIHHPNTDEKSISFEFDPTTTTSYLGTAVPGNGTHIRVTDWDVGTTEPGSSGSPLFDQNHRIIGQLHGGYAACGNDESDWYGRVSVSWEGGGTSASRLRNWLDPLGTNPVTVDLLDPNATGLAVAPFGVFAAEGAVGGPFTPAAQVYTLENQSATPLDFEVVANCLWLDVAGGSGTLAAGATVQVTVTVNARAALLASGFYAGTISFTNLTDGDGDTMRSATLKIGSPVLFVDQPLDSDPGWPRDGLWAFGQPTGGGGVEHGGPDPTSGHTGPNVLGYNLAGDYENSLPERHLVAGPFDCSLYTGVTLKYWRWLGVEQPLYDHASVAVSVDGASWTTIWTNVAEVTDVAWTQMEHDLAAWADRQPAVWIRWTMGTTDGSWQYCGWNLDDIQLWGLQGDPTAAPPAAPTAVLHQNAPNPFNPATRIRFELARPGRVVLAVYDLQGSRVRTLVDASLGIGSHFADWNGRDETGRRVGSGAYVYRLEAGDSVQERKLILLK